MLPGKTLFANSLMHVCVWQRTISGVSQLRVWFPQNMRVMSASFCHAMIEVQTRLPQYQDTYMYLVRVGLLLRAPWRRNQKPQPGAVVFDACIAAAKWRSCPTGFSSCQIAVRPFGLPSVGLPLTDAKCDKSPRFFSGHFSGIKVEAERKPPWIAHPFACNQGSGRTFA